MFTSYKIHLPALIAGALVLTSCTSPAHDPNEKYVLVTTNTKVAYWKTAFQGINKCAGELKVKAEMVGPDNYDPKAEHDDFQHAIQQKPAGILVSAADASLLTGDINSALANNIPVITIDSDAPGSKRLFFVGTDNYDAGLLGGQLLVKLLGGKGSVVVFTMPNQNNLNDRLHGYQTALEGKDIKITQVIDIQGDPTIAFDNAKKLLDTKAKVDAFVCLEAIACPEVGEVLNRENMGGKIKVIAMDADQRTLNWIQKGVIDATIAQKPFTMAYVGMKMLDDIHHHPPTSLTADWAHNSYSPLPAFVDTGTFIVDKGNLANYQQQALSETTGQQ